MKIASHTSAHRPAESIAHSASLPESMISMLRTPKSRKQVQCEANELVSVDGSEHYAVSASGIPLFATAFLSETALSQQLQYDGMVDKYVENLGYPHTQEYMAYLDRQLFEVIPTESLGTVAELCCGRGEAARLLIGRMEKYVGVDVSSGLLNIARQDMSETNYMFLQGDATLLPLDDQIFDNVFMLGGIHHVPDRLQLFREVHRILKPGGKFYFREPVDDFLLWRGIRKLVYRLSSALDHNTEAPLRKVDTESDLFHAGLQLRSWQTYGFIGFCLLMNSDVLVFNRLLRYLPGVRALTRMACRIDHWTTSLPWFQDAGLQVVGVAIRKPL